MTIHVGCDPFLGKLTLFDDAKKDTKATEIGDVKFDELEKVNAMFTEIKSNINGNLGCACFCLFLNYGNEIRKKIIEEGLKCGFKNVEIIDRTTAEYLYAMSQTSYKPMTDDVIWTYYCGTINVWQINDHKAKFVGWWRANYCGMDDLRNISEKLKCKRGPDIFLCEDSYADLNKTIEKNVEQFSKQCQFFKYTLNNFYVDATLIKARITAGDPDLVHLDVYNFLNQDIILEISKKEIVTFDQFQQLPINYSKKTVKKAEGTELIVALGKIKLFGRKKIVPYKLPSYKTFNLKFEVDENGIYYVNFENINETQTKTLNDELMKTENIKTMTLSNRDEFSAKNYSFAIPTKDILTKSKNEAIGIDLGTSRCCAAVNRKNGITTVPLDNTGERLLPSYVAYDEEHVKCGKVVVNRLRQFSKSTIFDSKRIIGRKFNDIEIDENWQFTVSNYNNDVQIEVNAFNGKRKISAEEVAADLLKHIKKKSEDLQGTNITKIVITVPAAFTEAQKAATIKAAKLAGWNEIVLLPEPVAAAFAYFVDSAITDNSNILLFDLGGGTLDVCIFKTENSQIKILSNTGDSKLGGRNFDTILINYFKNLMNTKYGISMLKDKKYKLMLECQKIKEDLSSVLDSSLDIDEYDTTQQGIIPISREEFEKMAQALINKVKNTIQSALYSSNLNANAINKVLLVGGGSRMPMIKQLLFHMFPKAEHCCEEHPDEVVAIGAAYYACSIFPSSKFMPPTPPMRMESIKN